MSLPVLFLASITTVMLIAHVKTSHVAEIQGTQRRSFTSFERETILEGFQSLKAEVKQMKKNVKQLRSDLQLKGSQLETLSNTVRTALSAQNHSGIDVAFEVTQKSHPYMLHAHSVYKFDTVVLNKGNGYHAATGIFQAPVSGTYLFWATVLPNEGNFYAILQKESTRLFIGYSMSKHIQCSVTYVTKINQGERVWFRGGSQARGIHGDRHSCYGGVLIHAN